MLNSSTTGNHSIVGYEAHGGQLRDEYIDLHLNTLARILSEKRLELREEADPAVWDITVKYVAHDISRSSNMRLQPL